MSKDIDISIRYLDNVLSSNNSNLILNTTAALLEAISKNCNTNNPEVKRAVISTIKLIDKKCFLKEEVDSCLIKNSLNTTHLICSKHPKTEAQNIQKTPKNNNQNEEFVSNNVENNVNEEENIDHLLSQLNLKRVPSFCPKFPDLGDDSDDDSGVTTKQKEEERAEQHGQKVYEEEIVKLPDGSEIRMKKTKTVNVKQTTKHVTISTKSANMPEVSRSFLNTKRGFDEDEEEENTRFEMQSKIDPFEKFRLMLKDKEVEGENMESCAPGQSSKSKTIERTSEISQKVSEKKERDGRLLAEHEASKLDKSNLFAKQVDSYQESQVATPPRMHVVEYMMMFGDDKKNNENEYLKGTTITSYVRLNNNLRNHEEQFKKRIQFEFSTAGTSATLDLDLLAELLSQADFASLRPPQRWAEDRIEEDKLEAIDWQEEELNEPERDLLVEMDSADYVIFREKDGKAQEVRGGPRDALIVYATQASRSSLLYQEAFLVTFRTIIPTIDILNKLIKRYIFMCMANDEVSISAAKNTFSVIVRIIDEIAYYELNSSLITSITSFVYRLILDGNFIHARILRERLLDRIKEPLDIHSVLATNISRPKKPHDLFDFKSADIASQLTWIDSQLYHRIETAELLWWAEDQNVQKCPNLSAFTQQFNNLSFWARTLIISQSSYKEREKYMMKFIKIMKHLREMGNLNSYLALLSAVLSTPLSRLEWNKPVKEGIKEHQAVLDTSQSNKSYRALLQSCKPPCIPYMGIILQDLTFVHCGNPNMIPADYCQGKSNIVNFLKRWNQYAILDSIRKLKKWNYDITKNDTIIQFFNEFKDRMTEDQTWEISYHIKPSGRAFKE
ncbi:unnamed protein product [Caenorhabditis bovis]|uniref:Ras-GEF domain-containing protein n=1 Tax=Caenorhabditis bovis TaxID=2654633 RepID=A0A8S1ERQ2_9PELO|nr:unnamed protein product [Caenorhabditis bovis]